MNRHYKRYITCILLLLSCALVGCNGLPSMESSASTPTPSPTLPPRRDPLLVLRMLNKTNGWAVTERSVVRTVNGGQSWHDVTPNTPGRIVLLRGEFRDELRGWLSVVLQNEQKVHVYRTVDGGQSWQDAVLSGLPLHGAMTPHFINLDEGWLECMGASDAGSMVVALFHTRDGGEHWEKLATTEDPASGLPRRGVKNGLTFKDATTGWATGSEPSGAPWLYKTTDQGKTWKRQSLPTLEGQQLAYRTTPPILIGDYGMMPVYVQGKLDGKPTEGTLLYKTYDGGETWQPDYPQEPGALVRESLENLYIVDAQHAWGSDPEGQTMYFTANAGKSWKKLSTNIGHFRALSFVDMQNGWAVDASSLYVTADGGSHWRKVTYSIR
uniref:Photosynthesis system II assembly factor Ycf48/Hcf136-like domain-containing protein n=1 Tax=Thermosporothrix sp. COM3 TaxID=2490863 RepID=A0A455SFR6_9CHLR|nr:hypothetical protein KTC_05300 [Thermosporothrix sp. COM3]